MEGFEDEGGPGESGADFEGVGGYDLGETGACEGFLGGGGEEVEADCEGVGCLGVGCHETVWGDVFVGEGCSAIC